MRQGVSGASRDPASRFVLGFTGTQHGLTWAQRRALREVIRLLKDRRGYRVVGLHGDCVGGDADFDSFCWEASAQTECRPCTIESKRAYTRATAIAPPMPPLERNREIVADADMMVACPKEQEMILRSGTWATIRAALKAKKPLLIIFPDGSRSKKNYVQK